jgi:hypothetical protein
MRFRVAPYFIRVAHGSEVDTTHGTPVKSWRKGRGSGVNLISCVELGGGAGWR